MDTAVVGSSIALLQERFKHLQRLKEMRQERELLKSLPRDEVGIYFSAFQDPLLLAPNSTPRYRPLEPSAVRIFEKHDVDTSLRL